MKLLYFAWLRERTGTGEEDVSLPPDIVDVAGLVEWLKGRGPGFEAAFQDLTAVRVAVDQEYVGLDQPLDGAGEVAFFPPVTGG
jgi:molybdopterin synthase sulfur carrier subunit